MKSETRNAIDLLNKDHKAVEGMFKEFKKLHEDDAEGSVELKQALMNDVCAALTVHAQIEEEIFYPAAREVLGDEEDLMNEAEVEHAGAKDLIAQIDAGSASDPMTCARFLVLSEQIDHHVKEEQEEMFPKVRKTDLDLAALGKKLAQRKAELEGQAPVAAPPGGRKPKPASRPAARQS